MIWSCKDCQKRYIGCHATCEDYINAAIEHKEQQQKIRDTKREVTSTLSDLIRRSTSRRKKP